MKCMMYRMIILFSEQTTENKKVSDNWIYVFNGVKMIHIIMCTYNGEKYIEEQLQSILENTVTDWKLYISDDRSADNTNKIVNEYVQRYPEKISLITHDNPCGSALHFLEMVKAVSKSMKGDDFIMLCDQDDIWYSNKIYLTLEHMRRLIMKNGNTIPLLVCSDVEVVDKKKVQIAESFRRMNHYSIKKLDFSHLLMENKVQGCTVMVNRALARKIYELPKALSMHDAWMGLIAVTMGKIDYIDGPTMAYRQHASNEKGSIAFRKVIFEQFRNMNAQKYTVYNQASQAQEFLRIYGNELDKRDRKIAEVFSTLEQQKFFERRKNIIKYHMWKTGIVRNTGLLFLI